MTSKKRMKVWETAHSQRRPESRFNLDCSHTLSPHLPSVTQFAETRSGFDLDTLAQTWETLSQEAAHSSQLPLIDQPPRLPVGMVSSAASESKVSSWLTLNPLSWSPGRVLLSHWKTLFSLASAPRVRTRPHSVMLPEGSYLQAFTSALLPCRQEELAVQTPSEFLQMEAVDSCCVLILSTAVNDTNVFMLLQPSEPLISGLSSFCQM